MASVALRLEDCPGSYEASVGSFAGLWVLTADSASSLACEGYQRGSADSSGPPFHWIWEQPSEDDFVERQTQAVEDYHPYLMWNVA